MPGFDPNAYAGGFDPNAYAAGFDPNAYAGASAPSGPSKLESAGRGAAQGATLGFGDEIQGAIQALLPVGNEAAESGGYFAGFGKRYKGERNAARDTDKAAKDAHGGYYLGGQLVGGAAPGIALGAAAPGLSTVGQGVALGAAGGAGESENAGALGTAGDALLGGAAGGVTAKIMQALPAALTAMGRRSGRRAITKMPQSLSVKKPVSNEAVDAAFDAGAMRPDRDVADRLLDVRSVKGNEKARIVEELTGDQVTGGDVRVLNRLWRARKASASKNSMGTGAPELYGDAADEIVTKVPGKAVQQYDHLGNKLPMAPDDFQLKLPQAENIKGSQQEMAVYDKVNKLKSKEVARRQIASDVRAGVERQVDRQAAQSPEAAARFVPIKKELGPIIEASNAANIGAARELTRRGVSPYTVGTMMAQVAHGGVSPWTLASGVGAHLLDKKGAQTAAWGLMGAGRAGDNVNAAILPSLLSNAGITAADIAAALRGKE